MVKELRTNFDMALVPKLLVFRGSSIVGYHPIFTYGQLIFVKIWNLFFLKRSVFNDLNYLELFFPSKDSTQLIFCFDSPDFVLADRFHAVHTQQ